LWFSRFIFSIPFKSVYSSLQRSQLQSKKNL
jgi:hypothetical protein